MNALLLFKTENGFVGMELKEEDSLPASKISELKVAMSLGSRYNAGSDSLLALVEAHFTEAS